VITVTIGGVAATADGTTLLSVAYPATIVTGAILLLFIGSKWLASSHSPPGDWNLLSLEFAGSGADSGSDTGTVEASVYYKIADGSETGNITVSVPSGNVAQAFIAQYARSLPGGIDVAATTARWTTNDTNPISVTFDDDPDLADGDCAIVFAALNANGPTNIQTTTLAATGATIAAGNQRRFTATGTGGDMLVSLYDYQVTAGASSAAPTWQATKAVTAQGEGPVILVRLREAAGGVIGKLVGGNLLSSALVGGRLLQ
jgi:hypothetical protein